MNICMDITGKTERTQRPRLVRASDLMWLRAGKAFVFLHGVVAICTFFLGLEYLIGWRWVPAPAYVAVRVVAMFGMLPFGVTAPIVALRMIFHGLRRHREWLYLGLCDVAIFALQIVSAVVASH